METGKKHIFRNVFNRSIPLLDCQYWDIGERVNIPQLCEGVFYLNPLFRYVKNQGTSIYYDFTDISQDPLELASYFNNSSTSP